MVELFGLMFCWLPIALLGLLYVIFTIWMVIDCAKNEPPEGYERLIWILVIIFLSEIGGPIIYYLVRRPERISKYGQ